jgi:hypothetical protein
MNQKIIRFEKDEEDDWMAIMSCGHSRHVRHNPPWFNRPWVELPEGRAPFLGIELNCKKCDEDH